MKGNLVHIDLPSENELFELVGRKNLILTGDIHQVNEIETHQLFRDDHLVTTVQREGVQKITGLSIKE
jgi:hypothetical protein